MRKWVPQALVVPWPCLVNRGCGHHSVRPVCSSSQGQGAAMIQPSQLLSHVSHPWSCSSENFLLTSLPWVLTHVRALSQSSFSNSSSISRQLLLQDMAPMYLHCKGFFLMTPGRGSMSPRTLYPTHPVRRTRSTQSVSSGDQGLVLSCQLLVEFQNNPSAYVNQMVIS